MLTYDYIFLKFSPTILETIKICVYIYKMYDTVIWSFRNANSKMLPLVSSVARKKTIYILSEESPNQVIMLQISSIYIYTLFFLAMRGFVFLQLWNKFVVLWITVSGFMFMWRYRVNSTDFFHDNHGKFFNAKK